MDQAERTGSALASILWNCSIDQRLTESVSPPTIKDAVTWDANLC